MITYNHSFPHFIVSRLMRGGRIHTIDADEDGEGEPQEESWFKKKEKRVGKLTKGKGVNKATASSRAIEYEDMMPGAYPDRPRSHRSCLLPSRYPPAMGEGNCSLQI